MSPRPIRLVHLAGQPAPSVIPLYRRLAADARVEFTVLYGYSEGVRPYDDGYGTPIAWDADLLDGYDSIFLRSADRTPGLGAHFWSARNFDVVPLVMRRRWDVLSMAGYNSATYVMAALAQRASGGALLFREEQTTLDPRSFSNTVAKQVVLRPYLGLGRGLFISTENRRWLEAHGVPTERLFASPYTVDNAFFQAQAVELHPRRDELRASFGIGRQSGPVIATVSRLIAKKQPLLLLDAFRRARERVPCVLLIVGTGPLEAEMREYVDRRQIPDVVFAGFLNRSEISRAYAAADVFTLLSGEKETFGLVVAEALNFGLPVAVSDRVGCAPDLVSPGHNGFVVPAGDPGPAAHAFVALASAEGLRARMGTASRQRIDSWNVERSAEGVVAAAMAATS